MSFGNYVLDSLYQFLDSELAISKLIFEINLVGVECKLRDFVSMDRFNDKLTRRQGNTDFQPCTAAPPWLSGEVPGCDVSSLYLSYSARYDLSDSSMNSCFLSLRPRSFSCILL